MHNRPRNRESGQALLEFALVLLVFLGMVYVIFEVGRAIIINQEIATASQEAVRLATRESIRDTEGYADDVTCDDIADYARSLAPFANNVVVEDPEFDQGLVYDQDEEEWVVDEWTVDDDVPRPSDCDDALAELRRGYRISITVSGDFDPVAPIPLPLEDPLSTITFSVTATRSIMGQISP